MTAIRMSKDAAPLTDSERELVDDWMEPTTEPDSEWAERVIDSRFELVDDIQLDDMPKPEWIIDTVLPANALVLLVAPPKSLKSFLALDWAMSIASGLDWHERRVKRGECIYIYAEGATGLQHRVKAWKTFNRIQGRFGVLFLPRRVIMNDTADPVALIDSILARSPDPRLVIIDTLARNMAGDENSTETMSAFVRGCDLVREETGATVVVVHHTGHAVDGRGRGSSVLPAAADTLMQLSRDGDRIQLECTFQKDAPEFPPLALQAVSVGTSLALKPIGLNGGGLTGNRVLALQAHQRLGGSVSYTAWRREAGFDDRKSSFGYAYKWLIDQGLVRMEGDKKYSLTESGRLALRQLDHDLDQRTPTLHQSSENGDRTSGGGVLNTPPTRHGPSKTDELDQRNPLVQTEYWEKGEI